jgi:hypothetical protein
MDAGAGLEAAFGEPSAASEQTKADLAARVRAREEAVAELSRRMAAAAAAGGEAEFERLRGELAEQQVGGTFAR